MVGPAALRLGVDEIRAVFAMKKRRACRVVGLAPATYYYRARRPAQMDIGTAPAHDNALCLKRLGWLCTHK